MTTSDIDRLRARAETGDAAAQYRLAAALASAGRRDEADRWLASAARLGEPDAGYTLATRRLQSSAGAEEAAALLAKAAAKGSNAARRLSAVLYAEGLGLKRNAGRAVELVVEAARANDPFAQRELAMLLLTKDAESEAGAALLDAAVDHDPVAGALYVRRACERRPFADGKRAQALLQKLAGAGYPNAQSLGARLDPSRKSDLPPGADIDWDSLASRIEIKDAGKSATPERISTEPAVVMFRNAFSPEECEYVMAVAAMRLAPSTTFDPRTGKTRQDAYRTSLTATLGPVDLDLALVAVNRRIARLAGRPPENGEFLSVLYYAPGKEYHPHTDWLPEGEDFERGGQRVTTALLYLNEDYEGGETHFLTPDIKVKGRPGDILVFHNVLPDGAPDTASRHAGLPVVGGAKWLGSKWFREKKYEF